MRNLTRREAHEVEHEFEGFQSEQQKVYEVGEEVIGAVPN